MGSYLTSAFLNSPFSLRGMLCPSSTNLKPKETYNFVYVWPGRIWKICLVFVFLLHMFDFTYYTVMQGIMGKAGRRSTLKLTAEGLKQNPLLFLCSI